LCRVQYGGLTMMNERALNSVRDRGKARLVMLCESREVTITVVFIGAFIKLFRVHVMDHGCTTFYFQKRIHHLC